MAQILSFPASSDLAESLEKLRAPGVNRARLLRALVRLGMKHSEAELKEELRKDA